MDKHWLRQNAANIITCIRILATGVMICLPTLSIPFLAVYAFAGFTDVLDGCVARGLKITSEFGSKLDSISDLIFFLTMMIKIFPLLTTYLPAIVMAAIYAIFGLRILIYVYVGLTRRRLQSSHSIFNKATGFLLYFVPFVIKTSFFHVYASIICGIAFIAAVNEMRLIRKEKM